MIRSKRILTLVGWALAGAVGATTTAYAQLDEIIVTATKREASIQDVPIAVSAFSAQQLERSGFNDLRDLSSLSASFSMNSTQTESQGTTLRLRGVGTTGNNIGLESAVGVFLDGVYLSRPGVALLDLVDLEQIEVLRGPQGTLFGRNTTAGAVNVKSKKPNLSEVEAHGNATYGNYDAAGLQASVNLPIAQDEMAIRMSGAWRQQDGFMQSATGGESRDRDRYFLRGQMLWAPDDNIDVRIIADYSDADEHCCDAAIVGESNSTLTDALIARTGTSGVVFSGPSSLKHLKSNADEFENPFEQWGISGEVNWDLGGVTATYIGSYRDFKAKSVQDSDFVTLDVFSVPSAFDDIQSQSHELRFQGETGRINWLFGAYYSDEKIREEATLQLGTDYSEYISAVLYDTILPGFGVTQAGLAAVGGAVPLGTGGTLADVGLAADPVIAFSGGVDPGGSYATNLYSQDGKSWSIFTHNTVSLSDNFDVVFGLRYVDESKDGSFEQLDANSPACINTLINAGAIGATPFAAVGALSVAFTCFPFATMADIPGSPATPVTFDEGFDDDELTGTAKMVYRLNDNINTYASYSHGFKAGGFNLDSTAAIGGASPSFNSEIVDAYEIGIKSDLADGRIRANLAVFHMDMEDFQVLEFTGIQFVTFNVPKAKSTGAELEVFTNPVEGFNLNASVTYANARYPGDCDGGEVLPTVSSLCGAKLTNAPKFKGNINASYETPFANTSLSGFVSGNLRMETKRRTSTVPNLPLDLQDGNVKLDLRAGVGAEDGSWALEVWAINVTDKMTKNVTFNVPLRGSNGLAPGSGARGSFLEAPRTYGATLRARF